MLDKIFILHFEDLKDRKLYLDNIIENFSIEHEFISSNNESDRKLIEKYKHYYKYDISIFERHLSKGEIAISILHMNLYERIINENLKYVLIVEDDSIFKDDFLKNLNSILGELGDDFDFCFISECCNLHVESHPNTLIYESNSSRCVSGYIVNSKNLQKVIDTLPFSYPIDWHLNLHKGDLKYYWSEPCLIKQGSENVYNSNLR